MIQSYLRAVRLTLLAGCLSPLAIVVLSGHVGEYSSLPPASLLATFAAALFCSTATWWIGYRAGKVLASIGLLCAATPVIAISAGMDPAFGFGLLTPEAGILEFAGLAAYALIDGLLSRHAAGINTLAEDQARHLDQIPARRLLPAVALSAALSLFMELAVIRWHTSLLELFAFYKNFSLLACFAGLGLGYALAAAPGIPLAAVIPLLAGQIALLTFLRHGLPGEMFQRMMISPVTEQLNMGWTRLAAGARFLPVYLTLALTFAMTALAFLPVGQLCGRLMSRGERLPAYGANLLGSVAGTALMLGAGFLWTPPAVWFAACFLGLVAFQGFGARAAQAAGIAALAGLVALSWPVGFLSEMIYSPYQLIERTQQSNGLMLIRAAGTFYQEVYDLSVAHRDRADPATARNLAHYEAPFLACPHPKRVAVVGAGTGNDVAAALRMGAERVDAIEIDPAIQALGAAYHPEHPYSDPRVRKIVNDARSHFRTCGEKYDLIIYGLLDSHSLLGNSSSVRLDSFVYTVEGIREAAGCLAEGGAISLSFCVLSPELGRKIHLMMTEAFGRPPLCLAVVGTPTILFLQARDRTIDLNAAGLPESARNLRPDNSFENPAILADLPTDDWPFFYMPRRVYPFSYLVALAMVAALSLLLVGNFVAVRPKFENSAFFFMGAGFMLVETKGITELGLAFGNTWQVVGFVIIGILAMAFLANGLAMRLAIVNPVPPFILLLATLLGGLAVSHWGGFPPTLAGRVASLAVLTCPIFFAGLAFSAMLARAGDVPGAMAINLLGAMLGGLLEYNSMYFGFRFLYWLAAALYLAALLSRLPRSAGWGGGSRPTGGCEGRRGTGQPSR